jgi:hypothetical protein
VPEDEFVPCRPGCLTCNQSNQFMSPGSMRWRGPTGEPYPVGPSVEPYRGRLFEHSLFATGGPVSADGPQIAIEHPPAYVVPRSVPRRPLLAGLIRRLWP